MKYSNGRMDTLLDRVFFLTPGRPILSTTQYTKNASTMLLVMLVTGATAKLYPVLANAGLMTSVMKRDLGICMDAR